MAQDLKEFRHKTPEFEGPKKTWQVCNSDLMKVQVQVVKDGGENNLHTHTGEDAFWYVVSGAVRFYGEGDKVIGEYQKGEGVLVPRGFKYWFESASSETWKYSASPPRIRTSTTSASTCRRKKIG